MEKVAPSERFRRELDEGLAGVGEEHDPVEVVGRRGAGVMLRQAGEGAGSTAGTEASGEQSPGGPAQRRRKAADQLIRGFVVALFSPGSADVMQERGGLQNGALLGRGP